MEKLTKREDDALSLYIGVMVFAGCCVYTGHGGSEEVFGWILAVAASAVFTLSGLAGRILRKLTSKR